MNERIDSLSGAPRLFAMVTTQHSSEYTDHALSSFFEHTSLRSQDRFLLIDNDKSYREKVWESFPSVEVKKNITPLSFAENVNETLALAAIEKADVFFLNNDLIFTEDWLSPLLLRDATILSPLGNQQVQYESETFLWKNALSLEEYLLRKDEFLSVVKGHREQSQSELLPVMVLGFFCVKLPFEVYSQVGAFDTSFGVGGGEDTDYCLRAYLRGFSVSFVKDSFILHFNQRSTGAVEDVQKRTDREEKYRKVFLDKWGEPLARLVLAYDQSILDRYQVTDLARSGDFRELTLRLLKAGGKEVPKTV